MGVRRSWAVLAVVLGLLVGASASYAHGADVDRRARVAVRVGSHAVTVGELEDRLAGIPSFQLATYGASPNAIVRAYTNQVIVRDLLLLAGAEERGLDKKLPTSRELLRARSNATLRALRANLSASPISDEDVRQYYRENIARFDSPERINIWRILCNSREDAQAVLAAAKRDPTVRRYNDLAREHSVDKATNMRGGNLGFVAPDGISNEVGLKVDPAVVKAASHVKDGEFVAEPVAEGSLFAVVWRRGTVAANKRTLEQASQQIRSTLYRERTENAERALIAELRAKYTRDIDTSLLGVITLPPLDSRVNRSRPAQSARSTSEAPGSSAVPLPAPNAR
ncbi:MAG: peptidyl-prolyl cis-trans isomerase [Polyangiaceae bacterium]|nr:peptidyl-prolyl cis-trans isomerase [Polyangiaceae bacterium]